MRDNKINEKPEVYALSQNDNGWQISRRDFLKAAGIGAAALGFGMSSYLVKPAFADESMEELCRGALSHAEPISELLLSPDGKYIISRDTDRKVKVWDLTPMRFLVPQPEINPDPPYLHPDISMTACRFYGQPMTAGGQRQNSRR